MSTPRRPVHIGVVLGREQLAGLAIEHVEEAVLRRLHDHRAALAADLEVGQHQLLHRIEVPAVARRGLVVPGHASGIGIEGDDRGGEQTVELAGPSWRRS
jgi:hypothetical protein